MRVWRNSPTSGENGYRWVRMALGLVSLCISRKLSLALAKVGCTEFGHDSQSMTYVRILDGCTVMAQCVRVEIAGTRIGMRFLT